MIWLVLALYFAPSLIAIVRGRIATFWLFTLNAALGWTGFVWLYCLADAFTGNTHADLRRAENRQNKIDQLIDELRSPL